MDVKIAGDVDGIETAREIRSGSGMPIIFTTGNSEPETVKRAKEVSNSYYLVKPILEMDLKKVLDGLYAIA
jgi:CheY-like chemotaxis protein